MFGKGWGVALCALMLVGIAVPPALGAAPPAGWTAEDIGCPTRPGSTDVEGTGTDAQWTVMGEGNDIWANDTDNFHYAYTQLQGDGNITARILSQSGGHDTDSWARNGLMIRESTDTDSRHLDFVLGQATSEGRPDADSQGAWYSYRRPETGEATVWNQTLANQANYEGQVANRGNVGLREFPKWVRLQRHGNVITAYLSTDGQLWSSQIVPQALGTSDLPQTMLVGLAVCGHNPDESAGPLSTMVADNVSVSNELLAEGPRAVLAIPSKTDTRVLVLWQGVPSATAYTIYRRGEGQEQYTQAGTVENASWFIDAGPEVQPLQAGNYRYVVTATIDGRQSAGSYPAAVAVGAIPSPVGPFNSYDIGTPYLGSTTLENGVLTIRGSGQYIWNNGDGFRFVATEYSGNVTMTARILEKPTTTNVDGWAKAGLMVRESLDPASRAAWVVATTNDNEDHASIAFQWRQHYSNTADESLGSQDGSGPEDTTYPQFLRISRNGSRIEGFQSADGTNFTKVGGDEGGIDLPRLAARIYIGFAVTNHRDNEFTTARFDANSIRFE